MPFRRQTYSRRSPLGGIKARLMIGLAIALFSFVSYLMSTKKEENPVTGEMQRVGFTIEEGVKLGMQSVDSMAAQHGGEHASPAAQRKIDEVGERLVRSYPGISEAGFRFNFTLLADEQAVNAFALPGGQIFITAALFGQFEKEDELAGVLGHEIGHVVMRHSAQQMAKSKLTRGIGTAISMGTGSGQGQMGAMVGQLVNTKYGRNHELESDEWGVKLMYHAGYDPRALITVMDILEKSAGKGGGPEFLSTHPSPKNRVAVIKKTIEDYGKEYAARGEAPPARRQGLEPRYQPTLPGQTTAPDDGDGASLVIPGR